MHLGSPLLIGHEQIVFVPDNTFTGDYTFTVTISDGVTEVTFTVTIHVG